MTANTIVLSRGVICAYEGPSGTRAMLEAMIEVAQNDCLRSFNFIIHDLINVTNFNQDDDALTMTAAQMQACIHVNSSLKIAIVSDEFFGDIVAQLLSEHLRRPVILFQYPELAMVWANSWPSG